ncbi:MAG TPA: hypothetical protein DCY03_29615 [Planctomycetaceae bacterium]|nr:hypothetical protein [Planctomycetaceae bacterium]
MHFRAEQCDQEAVSATSLNHKKCLPQLSTSRILSVGSSESACEPEVKQYHFLGLRQMLYLLYNRNIF